MTYTLGEYAMLMVGTGMVSRWVCRGVSAAIRLFWSALRAI